jgi:D-3-phosphoglycerate dehydrogenase / 2-oxoglutarate reductase
VRVVGRAGVGLDNIDLGAAREQRITVINQPAYGALEVATHAVGMIVVLQRKMLYGDRFVREGWRGPFRIAPVKPLDEVRVGLVGCGRIGTETARLLRPMVGEILVHDPYAAQLPAHTVCLDDLDELLSRSDVLSVHAPLTAATRGMLGRRQLELLPRGAVVVNVARGGMVDEHALSELLVTGHLAGAGLDVFEVEPLAPDAPILTAPNVLVTPHSAAYSERAMWRLASWTIGDVLNWLTTGNVVNGAVVADGRAEPAGS